MSGIDQRNAAVNGNHELLKQYIEARCNVCSTGAYRHCLLCSQSEVVTIRNRKCLIIDEFGLTPLHYAVWNGHVECVKLLICNTLGVDKDGNRTNSLSITSCLGYTGFNIAQYNYGVKFL